MNPIARPIVIAAMATGLLLAAGAARADVKAGVDAWNQGDYDRAIATWRPLAIGGDADAQFNLGQAYKLGRGVPVDIAVALEWFRRAADQNHEKARDNYGLLLFQQGRQEDAIPYIRASAERGEPRAQYVYATALFNGDLAPRDWPRAYALMTRASQAGLAQATTSLAQMDSFIPEAERAQGLALATAMANGQTPAPAPAAAPDRVAPPPAPVRAPVVAAAPPVAPPDLAPPPRPPVSIDARPARPATPAPRPAGAIAPTPGGRWRVQLGAFGETGRAQALWRSLSGRVSGLSAFQPVYVTGGGLTRLQAGSLASAAEAQRLCAQISRAGTPCIVKAP